MSLYTQYLAILEMAGTPPNEAATCRWIIDPVLTEVLGYGRTEWVPEETDKAGTKPDYTILPTTRHTWFLEAKSYSIALSEQHVRQATPYAHQSGQRWVALTNGIDWRVYDLDLPGQPPEKLALQARRDQPEEMEALLTALTRESVTGAGLAEAARRATLARFVREQLASPDSEALKQVWSIARKQKGMEAVTRSEVTAAVSALICSAPGSQVPAPTGPEPAAPIVGREALPLVAPEGLLALNDVALSPTGRTPAEVCMPDGQRRAVKSWGQAFVACVEWVAECGPRSVPVPWAVGPRTRTRLYTNTAPETANGQAMRSPRAVTVGGRTFYLETHGSAAGLVSILLRLCPEVGVDPAQFRISFRA
ncbi:MAG: type I restriction enzyme HsdR N-terminal domain-containing protein [Armatimonadetes bacterium]|nr:type I restriction enzyme HsdR N-terminal domain-containing protein [Armatimonadota bacterium]